nr:GDP-Man:Man(3)GlcNAc(2)-PP-Dol alpha-1,2-mannosyltransferase [Onthophagus taurus]
MSLISLSKIIFVFTVYLIIFSALLLPILFYILRWRCLSRKKDRSKLRVAFFHPYCNAGGGGEKVLWVAIQALQKRHPEIEIFVYTGDVGVTPEEIKLKIRNNLNVHLEEGVKFVYLSKRRFVEAQMYPYFTLLGQSLGSIYLGYEALKSLSPDIFIDTTGFAFTLPIFKYIGGCKTACYVHYPTITVEMLKRVSTRQVMYNNRSTIARSPFLTTGKLIYYRLFAWLYSLAGDCSDVSMVNSTFTLEHLTSLWSRPLRLVYPPCEVNHLKTLKRSGSFPENIRILSLAQFRPEKDHQLQIQAMYELREIISEVDFERITLVLCGSCRNEDDTIRVKDLKDFSKHLSLENRVEFRVNITYEELLKEFESASLGIHTMIDEHFGIGVVELLAAGLITIAHKSGGPLLDIIETTESSRLGYLAISAKEYAQTIKHVLTMDERSVLDLIERARASVDRFSNKKFQDEFLKAVDYLFETN